tara:strand:+ start:143 stop:1252 length:1110 start_codon:yes stop_codon:yes gene_type:complete
MTNTGKTTRVSGKLAHTKVNTALKGLTAMVTQAMDAAIEDMQVPPVEVPIYREGEHVITLHGHVNPQIGRIIAVAQLNIPICLFGGSGTGKTTLAKQVSEALELPFYCQTITAGMSESMLLGRQMITEKNGVTTMEYVQTPFLKAVEEGGMFLLDEFDAIDENCALAINNILEFGELDLPMRVEKPRLKAHPDFRFIACANTRLNGASLIHNGRNQLDGATISRFDGGIFEISYDLKLEKLLCPRPEIRKLFQFVRHVVDQYDIRKEISTRTLKRAEMLWQSGQFKTPLALLDHFLINWAESEKDLIKNELEAMPALTEMANKEILTKEESDRDEASDEECDEGRMNSAKYLGELENIGATELDAAQTS